MRYSDNKLSRIYSATDNYVEISRRAILIMQKQVGSLMLDGEGIAKKGLIIRHLILPNHLTNTEGVLKYIAKHLPKKTYLSLMSQYLPLYKAKSFPEISRKISRSEYDTACSMLEKYGIENGWTQEFGA